MSQSTPETAQLIDELKAQLAALTARLAELESQVKPQAAAPAPVKAPVQEDLSEEEYLAVSAALAAFLGVRLRIKQIRLVSSAAWAHQGRVSIHASHRLQS